MFALLRRRNFALLWFGGLISLMGDWILAAALPFYVYEQSRSTLATAVMAAASLAPRLAFSSMAGVWVDRGDRRNILAVASLSQGIIVLPLLLVQSPADLWIVYLASFFQTAAAVFFYPAENALLPQLVEEQQLLPANSLNALNNHLARLIGPPIGGLLLTQLGLSGVVLCDSVTFLVAGAMVLMIQKPAGPRLPETRPPGDLKTAWSGFRKEWLEGLAILGRDRTVALLFISFVLLSFGGILIDPLFPAFIIEIVQAGPQTFGLLLTVQALGGILGGLTGGNFGRRFRPIQIYAWGELAVGLLLLVQFNFPALHVVYGTALLVGLPAVMGGAAIQTLFQQRIPNSHLGRVSGAIGTTIALVSLGGVLGISGLLGERLGIVPVLNLCAAITILAGLIVLPLAVRTGRGAVLE